LDLFEFVCLVSHDGAHNLLVWFCSVQFHLVLFKLVCLVRFGSVPFGLVLFCLVSFGLV
jgi:hypothetical protein